MPGFVQVTNEHAYLACGLQGLGLIQPPRIAALPYLRSGQLREVLPQWKSMPMKKVSVAFLKSTPGDAARERIRRLARELVRALAADGRRADEAVRRGAATARRGAAGGANVANAGCARRERRGANRRRGLSPVTVSASPAAASACTGIRRRRADDGVPPAHFPARDEPGDHIGIRCARTISTASGVSV